LPAENTLNFSLDDLFIKKVSNFDADKAYVSNIFYLMKVSNIPNEPFVKAEFLYYYEPDSIFADSPQELICKIKMVNQSYSPAVTLTGKINHMEFSLDKKDILCNWSESQNRNQAIAYQVLMDSQEFYIDIRHKINYFSIGNFLIKNYRNMKPQLNYVNKFYIMTYNDKTITRQNFKQIFSDINFNFDFENKTKKIIKIIDLNSNKNIYPYEYYDVVYFMCFIVDNGTDNNLKSNYSIKGENKDLIKTFGNFNQKNLIPFLNYDLDTIDNNKPDYALEKKSISIFPIKSCVEEVKNFCEVFSIFMHNPTLWKSNVRNLVDNFNSANYLSPYALKFTEFNVTQNGVNIEPIHDLDIDINKVTGEIQMMNSNKIYLSGDFVRKIFLFSYFLFYFFIFFFLFYIFLFFFIFFFIFIFLFFSYFFYIFFLIFLFIFLLIFLLIIL
jgi:hypothetical protein